MDNLGHLFTWESANKYPHAPADGKTETSRACADLIKKVHSELHALVRRQLQVYGPATCKEVADRTGESRDNIQPRFSEFKALGLIVETGERRERCAVMKWKEQ